MSNPLRRDVWLPGRCSGCGACVAACSKGVLYWDKEQHPLLEQRSKTIGLTRLTLRTCEVCERFCEMSCPRLADQKPLGRLEWVSARSAGVMQSGEPNDVIQSILIAARSAGLIDSALMLDLDPWTLKPVPFIATTVDEIVSAVGMQFLWAPLLSGLNEAIFNLGLRKVAVVGSPCVAEGARQFMTSPNPRLQPYQEAIRLVIAGFCTGMYLPEMIAELFERRIGIPRHRIRSLRTSIEQNTMTVSLWDGSEQEIPLTEVERYTRRGCGSCNDFLGQQADIAIGSAGAQDGYATLILRTHAGENFLRNALDFGLVEVSEQVDEDVLKAAKAQKDRRARAQAFDEFRILMLDALNEPSLRASIRKKVAELYPTPQGMTPKKEKCDVSCGGC